MFLLEPGETQYDLNWRMFGVDVRVHPMFWLLSAILGFGLLERRENGFVLFLIWIGCVFFSILVHELGHVFMFRVFGSSAHIILYSFGGLAVPHRRIYSRWRRILISFAGPFAQLLIVAALYGLLMVAIERELEFPSLAAATIDFLFEINLFWAILNLLPIYPLDGGQISRDFLDSVIPHGRGIRLSLIISLALAALLTIHCLLGGRGVTVIPFLPWLGGTFTAIMFAMLAVQSFQMLQEHTNPPWRREG